MNFLKQYLILAVCILPLLSFSGCPSGCPDCVDKYYVDFAVDAHLQDETYFYIKEMCTQPEFTLSILDFYGNPYETVVNVPSSFTNPLTGYCAEEEDKELVKALRVVETSRTFIAKIQTFQVVWNKSWILPYLDLDFSQSVEHCVRLKFVPKEPDVDFIEPCDGIEITVPLAVQKSVADGRPNYVGDCPC